MMNKKGLSPLAATFLLVVFALIIGTITMSWGKNYVEGISEVSEEVSSGDTVVISPEDINTPLKKLQLDYIKGVISEEEYREKEKELIS